ncbi:dihydrofolate reductase [Aquipluma nitroreducens]|uniref:Dihydrofolate reductase n=1 Tax=Aquipluma nitroreducens TaxID=2010828 RepID=A0A5K7S870_9BACT|nr:dihydrofolate reductase family protein [Aquipluma nitroreducens]BBE17761.1 dihydrofolate reductase [Aquipluma nitroreducens]
MRKVVSFMHISLDGFVTNAKGEMSWINIDQEMFDLAKERTLAADIALYGRVTYELMEDYWPTAADQPNATKHDIEHSAWYNSVSKIVPSRTVKGPAPKNTRIISENLTDEIRKLKKEDGKEIIMFGSPSIVHELTAENLIDDYWLFVNPILLGGGNSLFKPFNQSIYLKLISSRTFLSGVVCLHYETKTNL